MGAGQHGPIGRQKLGALGVQQVVAENVDLIASRMKPVHEVQVCGELMRRIKRAAARLRTKINDRPPPCAQAYAAAVAMQIVGALQTIGSDISVSSLVEAHVLARRETEGIRDVE